MKPTITAFKTSPDKGRGLARDMRVRWALEEVGQPYDVKLVSFAEMKQPAYKELQPFGQIPAYIEGDLVLFETGAIILHIAQTHEGLLPRDKNASMRAIMWMFSSLSTVEQPIVERSAFVLLERDKPYYQERLPMLDERIHARLKDLSARMGNSEWIDGTFSCADIMMIHVLRRLESTELLKPYPNLIAYIARAEKRPAYQRAFAAQLEVFKAAEA